MKTEAKTGSCDGQDQVVSTPAARPDEDRLQADARRIAWRPSPVAARIYLKDLLAAPDWSMQLVRYDAGGRLALGDGGRAFLIYVLDGELILGDRRLWPGSALAAAAGASPGDSRSDVGCTILLLQGDRPGLASE